MLISNGHARSAEDHMPVKPNGPTVADGNRNVSAPTEPEEPDCRLHEAWSAKVSETADGLLPAQAPEPSRVSPNIATNSLAPGDRVLGQEARLVSPSRSGLIPMALIGIVFAAAVAAVTFSVPVSLFENWRPPRSGRAVDQPTSSEPLTTATRETDNVSETPKLIAEPSVGAPGEPVQMRLALRGLSQDAVVIVRGLIPGMELSAGTSVTGDRWELAATDLPYAWIAPPQDFAGSVELIAELRLPNAQIADRQKVHVEWRRAATASEHQRAGEQISGQKEIGPTPPIAAVQPSHNRDVVTAPPPMTAEPSQGQLGRKEGKSSRSREKSSLRRAPVADGSRSSPPPSSDNSRTFKGFGIGRGRRRHLYKNNNSPVAAPKRNGRRPAGTRSAGRSARFGDTGAGFQYLSRGRKDRLMRVTTASQARFSSCG
jgi:hypothetical protein